MMDSTTETRPAGGALRWLALVPAAIGLILVLVAAIWTELVQLLVGVALLAIAAATWRACNGAWPRSSPQDTP